MLLLLLLLLRRLLLLLPLLSLSRLTADVFSSLCSPPRFLFPSQQEVSPEHSTEEASHKTAAVKQLADLMEMGHHAQRVMPYCDGTSTVNEIVHELCLEDEVGSRTTEAVVAAAAAAAYTSARARHSICRTLHLLPLT